MKYIIAVIKLSEMSTIVLVKNCFIRCLIKNKILETHLLFIILFIAQLLENNSYLGSCIKMYFFQKSRRMRFWGARIFVSFLAGKLNFF